MTGWVIVTRSVSSGKWEIRAMSRTSVPSENTPAIHPETYFLYDVKAIIAASRIQRLARGLGRLAFSILFFQCHHQKVGGTAPGIGGAAVAVFVIGIFGSVAGVIADL
jgi:hypothetical protein